MKMRIPPRMPPKMKMMSRWTSCFFSFPFWHLMTKGEWKCHLCTHLGMCRLCIELMSFPFRFKLSWSFVKTMWCEILCNVCYSVLSCRTWVISKKFLLVCDIFELWFICFLFFSVFCFRKARYSGLQAGFSEYLDQSLRTYTQSLRVQLSDTHFIEWITCHMHHTYSWHSLVHPTVNLIRAFVFLSINMPIVDMSSQNWNSKFMAYI